MTLLASRAAALVGWLAHATGRLAGSIVWFARRGTPWALVIAALLAVGAWRSVVDTRARVGGPAAARAGRSRRRGGPPRHRLGRTSSIVRGPFLDSSSYGAPVQRWYYLLIDPRDDAVALIARSPDRLEERRTRTIVARVDVDPAAVAEALAGLDAGSAGRRSRSLPGRARRPATVGADRRRDRHPGDSRAPARRGGPARHVRAGPARRPTARAGSTSSATEVAR